MINRQMFIMKFNSSRLKKYKYDISNLTFDDARSNHEIVQVGENQFIRTINKVLNEIDPINNNDRLMDRDKLEEYYKSLSKLKRKKNKTEYDHNMIEDLKFKINRMCFIPEYVTVVINHNTHYDYIFENGFKINGVEYRRLSVSAGQGRAKTITCCSTEIIDRVNEILDNGRDLSVKFSPSKFSAYKGLYGSATHIVTTPRFCVVDDYESNSDITVNWVTETSYDEDDVIELKNMTKAYNRFDGMGLISPSMARKWADDLGLNYVPSVFCVRQSYLKGMFAVFDFDKYCREKNDGKYIVETMYGKVDLKNIDVIVTKSQFKLHSCFKDLDKYKSDCIKNELYWGVSLWNDNEPKNLLKLNYQFLGAMNIKDENIPKLCKIHTDWISSVLENGEISDYYKTLLFLVGIDMTEEGLYSYLKSGDNWWIKSLIVNRDLLNDKFIKQKIYSLIKKRIQQGYIGGFSVEGSNQTLVSDPYAMIEHVCGKPVVGLLKKNRYYSNYWNERGKTKIVGMRPPLTYRAEVLEMELSNIDDMKEWYKHIKSGLIVNIYGAETDYWAGSDFDYDFLSTTSNEVVLDSIFKNEYPVVYESPKVDKVCFTEKDLYIADKFTFGSIIGAITNKGTTGHALLPHIESKYGKDDWRYKTLLNRVKMTCKLQNAQIDKAKIGREVKGIPKVWTERKYIHDNYSGEEKDGLLEIMLDRHPYFFIHLYQDTANKYKNYVSNSEITCNVKFGISISELEKLENKTEKQLEFISNYHKYMPVVDNDSVMNNICRYLENFDYGIKSYIKIPESEGYHEILMRRDSIFDSETFETIKEAHNKAIKSIAELKIMSSGNDKNKYNDSTASQTLNVYSTYKDKLELAYSESDLVDYMVYLYYVDKKSLNKDLLWNVFGEEIFKNVADKSHKPFLFPIKDIEGDIEYLGVKYKLKEFYI